MYSEAIYFSDYLDILKSNFLMTSLLVKSIDV